MKVTVITGPIASGKTTRAMELTYNLKTAWMPPEELQSPFRWQCVSKTTQCIVIDEIRRETHLLYIKNLLSNTHINVEKRGKKPFTRPLPNIIIIGERLKPSDFKSIPNIEFIDLKTTNAHAL
jgi:thymidine kinase